MKKILLCVFFLYFSILVFGQTTISLQTLRETEKRQSTIPSRTVEQVSDGIVVTYYFNNVELGNDIIYKNQVILNIDGFYQSSVLGEPSILRRWDSFAIPNRDVTVSITDSSFVDLDMELAPASPVFANNSFDILSKDNTKQIIDYQGFYPISVIPSTRKNYYRNNFLMEVCVCPVKYNHQSKKVRIFKKIAYKVAYQQKPLQDARNDYSEITTSDNTFLLNTTINAKSGDPNLVPAALLTNRNYLIITVPKYATAANKFVEWKRTLGFNANIVIENSWDYQSIKSAVTQAYNNDSIQYLLIIGGHNDVPAYIANEYFSGENHYHPTDLYYGCMSEGYTPDIYRGRIPVNNADEAMTVVNKIINYEKNPIIDENFYSQAIHCAYFQDHYSVGAWGELIERPDGYEDRRFVLTSERIRNRVLELGKSVNRIYKTEESINPTHWNQNRYAYGEAIPTELTRPYFEWNGNANNITTDINNGAFYVLQRDHGSNHGWGTPAYSVYNIDSLNNGNKLPVIFSLSCRTGKFDEDSCFCEVFLKKTNGGCVSIYGATQVSISGPNDVLAESMFNAIWPSTSLFPVFPDLDNTYTYSSEIPTYRLGQILDQALRKVDEAYLNSYANWIPRYTAELFHCFGDPSMMITTSNPTEFTNVRIDRLLNKYRINTGSLPETISLYNRRTGEVKAYHGNLLICNYDPDLSICISGHNKKPYLYNSNLYIQNEVFTNDRCFVADTIRIGENVTTEKNQGEVIFSSGAYQFYCKDIELHHGTTIASGTQLEILPE